MDVRVFGEPPKCTEVREPEIPADHFRFRVVMACGPRRGRRFISLVISHGSSDGRRRWRFRQ